ncbi:hypothetical protein V1515DRAFT_618221 [Lipomyces mesembrius]
MAYSELLGTVRRPLSPDTHIEVPATRSEYERVLELLEEEDAKFPTLQYDGFRKVAIVSAAPSPLHVDMVSELLYGVSISNDRRNTRDTGDTSTTRNWMGKTLMVAVENLRAAISFSVCALRCRVGIAMSINEGDRGIAPAIRYYDTVEEKLAAIREIEDDLGSQLQTNPFGPLRIGEESWSGKVTKVVLETYQTLLNPKQSFKMGGDEVPPNLTVITIGDFILTHILTGNNIEAAPVNFFQQDWFEDTFRFAMLATAMERV